MSAIEVGVALDDDLNDVLALLEGESLPIAGVSLSDDAFLIARESDDIVGCIGLERYGDVGLLRSLAVKGTARSHGTGRRLVEALLERARQDGVREIYLLTTTADRYFPRFGFEIIDKADADPRLSASEEFRGACPDSAVCMRRRA